MGVRPEVGGRVMAEEVQARTRDDSARTHERDDRDQPVAKEEPHRLGIGCALRNGEGRVA
jgi:hypothetical protein